MGVGAREAKNAGRASFAGKAGGTSGGTGEIDEGGETIDWNPEVEGTYGSKADYSRPKPVELEYPGHEMSSSGCPTETSWDHTRQKRDASKEKRY